jgi:uncharacterized membrane protein
MSSLVVLGFADEASADAFISRVESMEANDIVELEDAAKVTVDADGKPNISKGSSLAAGGAVVGGFLGGMVGLLFLNPIAGAAVGAAGGAAIGGLTGDNHGIDKDFVEQTAAALQPGTAAVFLLVGKTVPDKVRAEMEGVEATIISTNLSEESEARLRDALQ